MKIKFYFFITFVFFGFKSQDLFSQSLDELPDRLNTALIEDDYGFLKKHLHKKLLYTHSNGWIESKKELIENLKTDVLVYKKIENDSLSWQHYADSSVAFFRSQVEVSLRGKEIKIQLLVEQCWQKNNSRWVLLRRKSAKIG